MSSKSSPSSVEEAAASDSFLWADRVVVVELFIADSAPIRARFAAGSILIRHIAYNSCKMRLISTRSACGCAANSKSNCTVQPQHDLTMLNVAQG